MKPRPVGRPNDASAETEAADGGLAAWRGRLVHIVNQP
jgi:hypothetical protein